MKNVILDLCGGTGAWSRPYKDAGYMVELITLPTYDVTRAEFGSHAMHFERMDVHYHDTLCVLYEDVYGILAAPPCTEFSLAKGGSPRDFESAMEVVEACMRIIWNCRINGKPEFWAMENPVGFMRQFMGVPAYQFEQWQFGEPRRKRTDIWGYFNPPKPTVDKIPEKIYTRIGKRSHTLEWGNPGIPPEYKWLEKLPYKERRAAIRAITPAGFAEAFYKANSKKKGENK